MKVVFLESIDGTALVGEIKEVKNGFARNFLFPQGKAAPAKEPYLTKAEAGAKREHKKQQVLDKDANAIAERLEGQKISLIARVGDQGRLFGSITSVHIAEEVAKLLGEDAEFDHRKVLLPEAIKDIGVQPVRLRLTRNVEAAIEVEVIAEGADEDEISIDDAFDTDAEEGAEGDSPEAERDTDEAGEAEAEEPKAELEEETPADEDVESSEDASESAGAEEQS